MAEEIFARQREIIHEIERFNINFQKDGASRKTPESIKRRLETLETLWIEFDNNNRKLVNYEDKNHEYFSRKVYEELKSYYEKTKNMVLSYQQPSTSKPKVHFHLPVFTDPEGVDHLISQQNTNFRALERVMNRIDGSHLEEKWEIEDELKNMQNLWRNIENLHLRIDNILQDNDDNYNHNFSTMEDRYLTIRKGLNKQLCSSDHLHQSTPQLDLPVFLGKYTQWPTFYDLFTETIHNSKYLTKTQKMQHLKSKVKGEAERLIQHLNITAENYDTAWDLLTGRYHNPSVLFTNQIELFLNQPSVQKQSSYELKRLHDTTMECIHAIHNLGIDTSTWDPILVHLVSKKLDSDTLTDYKESRTSPRNLPIFEDFMSFIERKFMALEPVQRREKEPVTSSKQQPVPSQSNRQGYYKKFSPHGKNYQAVVTSYKPICPLCGQNHNLFQCKRFLSQPTNTVMDTIKKLQVCKNCLYKHVETICPSTKTCKKCNENHNSIIHDAAITELMNSNNSTSIQNSTSNSSRQHNVNYVAGENEEILLTTLSLNIKAADGSFINFRALLDQGSQISLISENAAQILGLKRQRYQALISGVGSGSKQSKGIVSLNCHSVYGDYEFTTEALIVSKIINNLPSITLPHSSWQHIPTSRLADPEYHVSKPIDILLDASVYSEIIMSGLIKGEKQSPIAQQTKLGWILSGHVPRTFSCNTVIKNLDDIQKYWEVEDIHQSDPLTAGEQYCEDHYQLNTRIREDGRYEVAIPMKPHYEELLGYSKSKATAQFIQQEKRMSKDTSLSEGYKKFIQEYIDLGHMRPAGSQDTARSCYLPHHGVHKLDSTTTALRVVFNASSKTTSGHSLNDLMESGPNLQQDIHSLILKWRQHKYVITGDIEKMFRQIPVRKADQHLQTILWRNSPHERLQEYHLTTVTYGTKAAPFLAMRTLKQIGRDNADSFKLAAHALENSFYMDDLLTGSDSISQTKQLQYEVTTVLKKAGFNLRKWSSNEPALIQNLPKELHNVPFQFKDSESRKTLGLNWTPSADIFTFSNNIDCETNTSPHTKRQLLSDIAKIYDPMGWLTPLSIKAKILFQKTWALSIAWDDKLPESINNEWAQIRLDFKNISRVSIPRYLGNIKQQYYIHGFCDASEKAYAAAIYIVTLSPKGEYTSTLVTAKSKVVPHKKNISLPRLELLGALLLSQLMAKFLETITSGTFKVYAWSDSMVVLGWLYGKDSRWKQFVANRVCKIKEIIPSSSWHHVKSGDNAADCATRGLSGENLLKHKLWWQGPEWLSSFDPKNLDSKTYPDPMCEVKRASVNTALFQTNDSFITTLLNKFSSIIHIVNIIAWIRRFISRLRNTQVTLRNNKLSTAEFRLAYEIIIRNAQKCNYYDEIKQIEKNGYVNSTNKLSSLKPFLDDRGILRVGGRLEHSELSYSAKHPIILAPKDRFTTLIIHQAHLTTLHGGPKLTLAYIREQYWIVSGIRAVKGQIRLCVKCRRHSQQCNQQLMADLPAPRVTPSRPFTNVGVDFTGHVDVKSNKGRGIRTTKGYVAVFICLVTKAVHLELVSELSTEAFLAALRRMCARRGTPANIYSDNGTNFIGAARSLKKEYIEIIHSINTDVVRDASEKNISWHFNCPAHANAGGIWEAAVKSFKFHLNRIIGEQKLTYEEFITLLHQIEACLNSRPLCALTENPDDLCLTPGHFLIGGSLLSRPQTDPEHMNPTSRWRLVQAINKQFWKKWSSEYLQQLQIRTKWRTPKDNIQTNDVVIIKDDNQPPGKWSMGRVEEIHPGRDGLVRVVTLKTKNNLLKRPINKLIKLPVNNQTVDSAQPTQSRLAPDPVSTERIQGQRSRGNALKSVFSTLLLFLSLLSLSMQPASASHYITPLNGSQNFYFDKISDLQHIRDEWKLVVYYNFTSFWQGIEDIELYINHLRKLSRNTNQDRQFDTVILQLDQQLSEITHYNDLLKFHNKRYKRGLVNGVGNAANYLFGVLDDNFAVQYQKDIEKIAQNENHLQRLIQNQTLVVESEYKILRHHEKTINTQFQIMRQYLRNISSDINRSRLELQNSLFISSSILSANIIMSNLRSIQQSLIRAVTDVTHGNIDSHLLTSEQLQAQVSTITHQLQGDLTVPDKDNMRELFKLLRVSTRVIENYLIMEFKIPLITNDVYELDKIISLPYKKNQQTYRITTAYQYLAFNIKKDVAVLLSHDDLDLCIHASNERILCPIDKPIYDMRSRQSICELKLINMELNKESLCIVQQSTGCNKFIKLQRRYNVWLYTCCEKCSVRILCPTDTEIRALSGNGLISLDQGCTVRGKTFNLLSHNNFFNRINAEAGRMQIPQMSILNEIIQTSIIHNESLPAMEEDHSLHWEKLGAQIEELKQQSTQNLTIHDVHQYIVSYSVVGVLIVVGISAAIIWFKRRRLLILQAPTPQEAPLPPIPPPRAIYTTVTDKATGSAHQDSSVTFNLPKF